MGSSAKVLRRMDERISQLSADIPRFLRVFEAAAKFSGPSLYFHLRTLDCLRRHRTPVDALSSEEFFDNLYATLASWGMHRMGKGKTKLRDLPEIKASVRAHASSIEALHNLSLGDLHPAQVSPTIHALWALVDTLSVSIADAKIVANSKVLHHILPELIPPIDRTYTFNLFYNRNSLTVPEEAAFTEMMTGFYGIAVANRRQVVEHLGSGWNSSKTKVLDNAVVGYVVDVLQIEEE